MIDNTPPPAMDMIKKADPNLVYFPSPCMDSGQIAGHNMALVKLNKITAMIDIRPFVNSATVTKIIANTKLTIPAVLCEITFGTSTIPIK